MKNLDLWIKVIKCRFSGKRRIFGEGFEMKIAFFKFSIMEHGGGLENYFINTSSELSKRYPETEISIITLSDWHTKKLVRLLSLYYLRKINMKRLYKIKKETLSEKLGRVKYIKATSISNLKQELQKYDLIYSKNEILDLLVLKGIGYRNLPPIIAGAHTPINYPFSQSIHTKLHNFLYKSYLYKFLLNDVKLIHVLNNEAERFAVNNFNNRVKKIYNPFDIESFYNKELSGNPIDPHFDKDKINIIFIGRITMQKGINDLEKIIKRVVKNKFFSDRLMFHIYGDGDLRYIVEDLSKSIKCVKYYGYVIDAELPIVLKNADLFISPAKWESLPYNIIEAQAMGVPVIAYDIPGPRDIIINKKTGLLVKNIDEFVQAICDCSEGKYKFENISEKINNKFNPDKIYTELFEMFKSTTLL